MSSTPEAAAVAVAVVDDDASKAAKKAEADAAKAAKAAAKAEAAKIKAAADAEAKAKAVAAAAIRDQNLGTKVANTFGSDTYFGKVTTARTSKEGVDYYQVTYSDGDQEELELAEVQAAHERYQTAQADMWDLMTKLVGLDASGVAALKASGITSVAQLELFGGGAAAGNAFDKIAGLAFLTKQQLHVVATFLLNDGVLTPTSTLAELARFNLAKQNGTTTKAGPVKPAAAPKATRKKRTVIKKKTVAKAATPKKKPGRPAKKTAAAKKATASPGKKRGRPKKNA